LWHLGYPEQARTKSQAALALARELSQPSDLAFALGFAGWFYRYRREALLAHERAEATIALSREQGFPFWLAFGMLVRGWTLAQQGRAQEGIAQMRQGLAAYRAIGSEVGLPHILSALAELYGQVGQSEEGLKVLVEALALMNNNDNRYYESELYRLKGELVLEPGVRGPVSQEESQKSKGKNQKSEVTDPRLLTPDPEGEAEACFLKAIEIARKQQAKSLELRAAMSLVRLRQQQATACSTQRETQGKLTEAHTMLSSVYNWFTEGFDTRDLRDAKTLLEQLHGDARIR
jgi:predicted ATPase